MDLDDLEANLTPQAGSLASLYNGRFFCSLRFNFCIRKLTNKMDKEKSIAILNTLIEINNDRIAGYKSAEEETEEDDLKSVFSECRKTSIKFKKELVSEVQKLGGMPTQETKTEGKVFRAWREFKTALTAHHSKSILNSCEIGEQAAVDAYNNALSNDDKNLSAEQQILISVQCVKINAEFDQIKGRRDMLVEQK